MALVRWNPFQEIEALQRDMNELFDGLAPRRMNGDRVGLSFVPAAEMNDTAEAIELKLEVPGLKPEDLDIQVTADAVSISGERKSETKSEEGGVTRTEFRYGSFRRVIPLPSRVQNTNVTAEYKDGILHLNLPKAEEEKNRIVKVNVNA